MVPLDGRLPHWPSNKHHHNGSDICPCGGNGLIGKTYRIVATFRRGRPTRAVKKGFIHSLIWLLNTLIRELNNFILLLNAIDHTPLCTRPQPLLWFILSFATFTYFWLVVAWKIIHWRLLKATVYFFVIPCIAPNDGTTFPNALYPGCVSSISPPLPLTGCCMESFNGGHLRSRSHLCLYFFMLLLLASQTRERALLPPNQMARALHWPMGR